MRLTSVLSSDMELPFLIAHLSLFTGDGSTPLDMGSAPGSHAPPLAIIVWQFGLVTAEITGLAGPPGFVFSVSRCQYPLVWSIPAWNHPSATFGVSYRLTEMRFNFHMFISVYVSMDASGALTVAEQVTL